MGSFGPGPGLSGSTESPLMLVLYVAQVFCPVPRLGSETPVPRRTPPVDPPTLPHASVPPWRAEETIRSFRNVAIATTGQWNIQHFDFSGLCLEAYEDIPCRPPPACS
ncbi:hypothetical protein CKAH01_06424 [Colletotrichum kahawae]|uniref:Uncharacterized protein n=1 Tax=Colletotrichum kahawae TaxID=34407 RepID=A0AAD9YAC3_COLKA|nr:hypothetical protein CKAH01_06424 [Colletotrichum kahawae]